MAQIKTEPTTGAPVSRVILREKGAFDDGEIGGDARQIPRCYATTPADPELVLFGIDITRPMITRDFGEWFTTPEFRGMYGSNSSMGCGIDREDPKRMLMYGCTGSLSGIGNSNYNVSQGISLSTDGGKTAKLVLSLPDSPGSNRSKYRYQAHYVSQAPGGSGPTTRTWHVVHASRPWNSDVLGDTQFYKSTDGGSTWAKDGSAINASNCGLLHGIECRKDGDGYDLYRYGDKGLHRRPHGSSSWTLLSGQGGLTAGKVTHVQVRDSTLFVAVFEKGLFKSTNGTNFTKLLSYDISQFAVTDNWIFVSSRTGNVNAKWSEDGGVTWTHGGKDNIIKSIEMPGQLDSFSHNLWKESVLWVPHETDPNKCLVMRSQHMGRIDTKKNADGNIQAVWSSRGFDYSRINSFSFGGSHRECAITATDRCCMYADQFPDWVHDGNIGPIKDEIYKAIEGTVGEYNSYQAAGAIILDNGDHKRVVMLVGKGEIGSPKVPLIFSPKNNEDGTPNPIGAVKIMSGSNFGTGESGARNPENGTRGCLGKGRYAIDSSGNVTREATFPHEFCGYSDGAVIWGRGGDAIYRSDNEGDAWSTAFAPPSGWTATQKKLQSITPSAHDNGRCYRCNEAGQVHRIDDGKATLVFDFIDVMALLEPGEKFVGKDSPPRPAAVSMTEDPSDADLLHVAMNSGGTTMLFRSTTGGGAASEWAAVEGAMLVEQDVFICPTGEVLSASRHGTTIFDMPDGHFEGIGITGGTIKGDVDGFYGDSSSAP